MALATTGVFEVRPSGSDNNAGYFNPSGSSPGTDFSTQDAAQVTIDGATITATVQASTSTLLIAGTSVASTWNRNGLRVTGGTATAGLYEITAVNTGTNVITVDRSAGTNGQTATGVMGGGLATPGAAASFVGQNTQTVWMKAGTYTIGTGSANTAGNRVATSIISFWRGYNTTRGDNSSTRPVLDAGGASITVFTLSGSSHTMVENVTVTNTGAHASVNGFSLVAGCLGLRLKATVSGNGFTSSSSGARFVNCEADTCGALGFNLTNSNALESCVAKACVTGGFGCTGSLSICSFSRCVAKANTASGFAASSNATMLLDSCTSYGNTGASSRGFYTQNSGRMTAVNCVAYGNGERGFYGASSPTDRLIRCAGGGNTGVDQEGFLTDSIESFITLTADPFFNAAGSDFSLNTRSGGGRALRGAGFPSTYPGLSGSSTPDVGAYQSSSQGYPRMRTPVLGS